MAHCFHPIWFLLALTDALFLMASCFLLTNWWSQETPQGKARRSSFILAQTIQVILALQLWLLCDEVGIERFSVKLMDEIVFWVTFYGFCMTIAKNIFNGSHLCLRALLCMMCLAVVDCVALSLSERVVDQEAKSLLQLLSVSVALVALFLLSLAACHTARWSSTQLPLVVMLFSLVAAACIVLRLFTTPAWYHLVFFVSMGVMIVVETFAEIVFRENEFQEKNMQFSTPAEAIAWLQKNIALTKGEEDVPLTLENVLGNKLNAPFDLATFYDYLKSVHAEESVDFLLDFEDRVVEAKSLAKLRQGISYLFENYLVLGAPRQLNLSAKLTAAVAHTFEDAGLLPQADSSKSANGAVPDWERLASRNSILSKATLATIKLTTHYAPGENLPVPLQKVAVELPLLKAGAQIDMSKWIGRDDQSLEIDRVTWAFAILVRVQVVILDLVRSDQFVRFLNARLIFSNVSLAQSMAFWMCHRPLPTLKQFFTYPEPINLMESRLTNLLSWWWMWIALFVDTTFDYPYLYFYLLYGFAVRSVSGPRLSPDSLLIHCCLRQWVLRLRLLADKFYPSPPRRFAQVLGFIAVFFGLVLRFARPSNTRLVIAAQLWMFMFSMIAYVAAAFDYCLGCYMFKLLILLGLVPESICAKCRITYHPTRTMPGESSFPSNFLTHMTTERNLVATESDHNPSSRSSATVEKPGNCNAHARQISTIVPDLRLAESNSSGVEFVNLNPANTGEGAEQTTGVRLSTLDLGNSFRLCESEVPCLSKAPSPSSAVRQMTPADSYHQSRKIISFLAAHSTLPADKQLPEGDLVSDDTESEVPSPSLGFRKITPAHSRRQFSRKVISNDAAHSALSADKQLTEGDLACDDTAEADGNHNQLSGNPLATARSVTVTAPPAMLRDPDSTSRAELEGEGDKIEQPWELVEKDSARKPEDAAGVVEGDLERDLERGPTGQTQQTRSALEHRRTMSATIIGQKHGSKLTSQARASAVSDVSTRSYSSLV